MILLQTQVNNEMLFVIAITVAMLLVIAFFSVYLFFLFQKRKIRLIQQQQEMKETYDQEILKTQIAIRDQTMKEVGWELHDHIGQVMTVIKLNLAQVNTTHADELNKERILFAKELVGDVIQDLRSLSKTLNGDLVQQAGLPESIAHELARINKLNLTKCLLEVVGDPYTMPAEKEFVVFRIVQENLNNILKHARSKNVLTRVEYRPALFTLYQKDDGKGYDIEEVKLRKKEVGNGLLNMQLRCDLIKADLNMSSKLNEGTELLLKITFP